MEPREEAVVAPASTAVPQDLLEEMVWFFRVEDASPWNYSMLVLAALVVVISMYLLARNIRANRQSKLQPQEKETPEGLQLEDSGAKPSSSLKDLRETLISGNPNLVQVGTFEAEKTDVCQAFLPDATESES
ncbi:PREDICTED: organic solute transporter subunit beta [Dipodomys ordii]|uniref:Organic solute transporter subunit beta n=1 Tax=Dipodomys ordii TaxID=10020 RepID=A0A1S3EMB8_DIPOR|nr:PREDICTED: organic solute transporter subunit beta [Dipodomys ordii]